MCLNARGKARRGRLSQTSDCQGEVERYGHCTCRLSPETELRLCECLTNAWPLLDCHLHVSKDSIPTSTAHRAGLLKSLLGVGGGGQRRVKGTGGT